MYIIAGGINIGQSGMLSEESRTGADQSEVESTYMKLYTSSFTPTYSNLKTCEIEEDVYIQKMKIIYNSQTC